MAPRTIAFAMAAAKRSAAPGSAEALLERMTPHARTLAAEVRALVKELIPRSVEHVHMGWEVITFGSTAKMGDAFAALAFRPTYVNVQFMDAAELPDPKRLLEGTGKRMRHVKVYTVDRARSLELRALITAAAQRRGL